MHWTIRVLSGLLMAVVTMTIGVGFVRAAGIVMSLFADAAFISREQPAEENIGVTSTQNFRTLAPQNSGQGRVLSCYDLNILPIWRELKSDSQFIERLSVSNGVMNCSDMVEIRKVDLNQDGVKEFLVHGKGPYLCSAMGNCGFWVFEQKQPGVRILLTAADRVHVQGIDDAIQRSRSRGYSNLLLKEHFSAAETTYRTYVFDGRRYIEDRCSYEVPKYDREGEGAWKLVTCKAFERELNH
jgi:hypothetical protein